MKIHNGGLGNFLNEVTQTAQKSDAKNQIVYIDINEIESNPQNFYGLRDIDSLAGLIAVSHLIEPLTVTKKPDGRYLICRVYAPFQPKGRFISGKVLQVLLTPWSGKNYI